MNIILNAHFTDKASEARQQQVLQLEFESKTFKLEFMHLQYIISNKYYFDFCELVMITFITNPEVILTLKP